MSGEVTELLATSYAVVSLEQDDKIVRYRRLPQQFADLSAAQSTYDQVLAVLERIGRTGRGLLVDSRAAIGRNDAAFETLLYEFRRRSIAGFVGHAVLMRTAVGSLHAQRLEREQGTAGQVFMKEADAVAHLLKLVGAESPPRR